MSDRERTGKVDECITGAAPQRGFSGRGGVLVLLLTTALSGAGSIAAVRCATPPALDEWATAALLFFLAPGLLIAWLGARRRMAAIVAALLIPFLWTLIASGEGDPAVLFAIPAATAIAILLAARLPTSKRLVGSTALVLTPALVAGALFWPGPAQPDEGPSVLLIGIDGATWDRIDPLVAEGKLPHFERLLAGGHRADLRTLPSMYSPQVWSTIATGCPPSDHGIEDFTNRQSDFRVGRIWDQLDAEGRPFGTCGWYFTWPPPPDLGAHDFVVPSFLAPAGQAFPRSASFLCRDWACKRRTKKEVPVVKTGVQAFRNGVRLSTLRRTAYEFVIDRFRNTDRHRESWKSWMLYSSFQGDVFAELVRARRPEFAAVLFKEMDRISHFHWKSSEDGSDRPAKGTPPGVAVDSVYIEMDRILGRILASAPEDADVMIVSDHGFQAASAKLAGRSCRIDTTRLIGALGLEDRLVGRNMDPTVYLGAFGSSPGENEKTLDRTEAILAAAHIAGEKKPLFDILRRGRWIWLDVAERDSFPAAARVLLNGKEHPLESLVELTDEPFWTGVHHPDGIYLLAGPAAARADRKDSLNVLDVAPTVAALLDLPRSPLWRGRAALQGQDPGARPEILYPLPRGSGADPLIPGEDLDDALRALGYLK